MKQIQRKAVKAALGCLVLLLLYGCASHTFDFSSGGRDVQASGAELVWTNDGPDEISGASDELQGSDVSADSGQPDEVPGISDASSGAAPEVIAVYVCGAVKEPGVYELAAGSRVYEAVALAGGMTKEASACAVNQAEVLHDGQMIVIRTEDEEAPDKGAESGESGEGAGMVNINTAGVEELKTLPGIGDAKAAAIVAYRKQNGAFASVSDIKKVSGIGERVFSRLEGLIKTD